MAVDGTGYGVEVVMPATKCCRACCLTGVLLKKLKLGAVAYLNLLFSIPGERVSECTSWDLLRSMATYSVGCSHLIAYWAQFEPLNEVLSRALDGGLVLNSRWKHKLRVPTYHNPAEVTELAGAVANIWQQAIAKYEELANDDWWRIEIEKCLALFQHAANRGEAVVSILEQSSFTQEELRR